MSSWRAGVGVLITLLLCTLLAAEGARERPVVLDETAWLCAGQVAWELLTTGAGPDRWAVAFDERNLDNWGNKNPPLGKYVVGVAIAGEDNDRPLQFNWHWGAPRAEQDLPPDSLLRAGRAPMIALGCLTLLTVFLLGYLLTAGSVWSALAPALLFTVPSFQRHAFHVFTEMPQLWLLALASALLLQYTRRRQAAWLLAAMVCAGLAAAVKFSAGALCVGAALFIALEVVRRRTSRWLALAALLAAPAAYVLVNPYLYTDPLGRTLDTVEQWNLTKVRQQNDPLLRRGAVTGPAQGLHLIWWRGVWLEPALGSEVTPAMEALDHGVPGVVVLALCFALCALALGWRARLGAARRELGVVALAMLCAWMAQLGLTAELHLLGPLLAAGAIALVQRAATGGPREPARAMLLLLSASWLITGLWLPFDWSGYYLPVTVLAVALPALGAASLADRFVFERSGRGGVPRRWLERSALVLGSAGAGAALVWIWHVLRTLPPFA